ncbi:MAG: TolC family protein [Armatimonadota bacterium]
MNGVKKGKGKRVTAPGVLFLWTVIALSALGYAHADNLQPLTISDAIQEALQANPKLQAATRQVKAAQQQTNVVKGQLYGEVDAIVTAQQLDDAQLLRPMTGPITSTTMSTLPFADDQIHAGLSYNLPLYVGGRITNEIAIAQLGADRARSILSSTRSDLIYNTTALFSQAQALTGQARAIGEELTELDTTRANLELSVKIGKRPEVDMLKVVDRISEAQAAQSKVLAQRKTVVSTLMALMGRDPATEPLLAPLAVSTYDLKPGEADLKAATLKRSSVMAAIAAVKQADRRTKVASAALAPSVYLQANYMEHTDGSDHSLETWFVGLQISCPVFDGGSRRAAVSRSREDAEAALHEMEAVRLQAAAELQSALAGWDSASEQLKAANAQLAAAREVARIEQLKYDTGGENIEDLLRARTREEGAVSAEIAARAQMIISGAQINRVTEMEVVK